MHIYIYAQAHIYRYLMAIMHVWWKEGISRTVLYSQCTFKGLSKLIQPCHKPCQQQFIIYILQDHNCSNMLLFSERLKLVPFFVLDQFFDQMAFSFFLFSRKSFFLFLFDVTGRVIFTCAQRGITDFRTD